jgi:hypothetical protein
VSAQTEEFCPRCGHWCSSLDEYGWCHPCTAETGNPATGKRCTRCGKYFPFNNYSRDKARDGVQGGRRPTCRDCDNERRRANRRNHPNPSTPSVTLA